MMVLLPTVQFVVALEFVPGNLRITGVFGTNITATVTGGVRGGQWRSMSEVVDHWPK